MEKDTQKENIKSPKVLRPRQTVFVSNLDDLEQHDLYMQLNAELIFHNEIPLRLGQETAIRLKVGEKREC